MVSSDVWYSSLIKREPCAGIWLSSRNTAWQISLEYFAWDGKCGYFSMEKHRCENPTCVSITSNFFFCLNGNVCKSVQIYKSFYSTSKLPGHSSCLFWCNRQIKPTHAQDIMIQFVWATKQSLFPQKPAAAKKKMQKIVQMLMVGTCILLPQIKIACETCSYLEWIHAEHHI